MIISIDSGNKNIKTEHFVFPSSISESDFDLGFGVDIMEYNGKYYSLDGKRIKYMRDKTADDRFFILTLFGIAKEIEKKIADGRMEDKGKISASVTLLNGMPPKHLANSQKFEEYFLTDKPAIFTYNKREYKINIKDVYIFPQAYALIGMMKRKITESDQVLIVDMGGWTLDYMVLTDGRYNMSECESLEYGIIKIYNQIQSYCNSKFDINFNDRQIDSILKGTYKAKIDEDIKQFASSLAENYCNEIVNTLREQIEGFRTMPIIFAGGGAVTLKKYFENNPLITDAQFIEDVCANAKGYKALYKRMR